MTFPNAWDGVSPSRPDPAINAGPDDQDWATLIHEHTILSKPVTAQMDGAVSGLVTTHGGIYLTRFAFTALSIAMVDATTAGAHGSQKILELVTGRHVFLAVDFNLTILAGAGGLADTAQIVGAIGSTATAVNNATLLTTEANVLASNAFTLSGGTKTVEGGNVVPKTVDCTELFLNFAVPDAGSTADDTLQVDGTVSLLWAPWNA